MSSRDPSGAVPAEDADGRLVLDQTHAMYAKTALSAFLAGCLAVYSLLFWHKVAVLHGLPPATDIRGRVFGVASLGAWPVLPWLLLNLALPPRLTIDAQGITARGMARTRRLGWEDVREIRLREVTMGRGSETQTQTVVSGPDCTLSWLPVYGVAPNALAAYLVARRRAARPTVPIELVDTTPDRVSARAGKAMEVTRLLHLALVLGLGVFALVAGLVASFAVRGSPLAAYVLGRLLH